MKNLFIRPNKELTFIGGAASFAFSLFVAGVLAILFAALHAAFAALPAWVIGASIILLTVGVFISRRLKCWRWVVPAALGWTVTSFAYFLCLSSQPDPTAVFNVSKLGVGLLSMSLLFGGAASVLMPLVLNGTESTKS